MRGRHLALIPLAFLAVLVCMGPTSVWAQPMDLGYPVADSAYGNTTSPALPPGTGWMTAQPADDLEARVAELEAALKETKSKDAAAKKSAAGKPTVAVGGRIQVDWAAFSQNDASMAQAGDFENGTEFRRAWIALSGNAFDVVDYKFEVGLDGKTTVRNSAGTSTSDIQQSAFKDVYITIKELPVLGNVRVGHFKTPFSLEYLTSSKYLTFMERATPVEVQVAGYKTGVMAFDHNEAESFTWAVGAFACQVLESPPTFQDDNGGTSVVTRMTYLPWYDEATEGRGLWHTGLAYAYLDIADGNALRLRQRPESHLASYVVDTGSLADVAEMQALEAETALVYGPFSVQAEGFSYWLNRTGHDDARIDGAYAFVSYFLTGENRAYKRGEGVFDRIRPYENFFRVRDEDGCVQMGKGAWEIAYRISCLDMNDASINGGIVTDHTLGLNWYLNPYTTLMLNYVHSETTNHPTAAGVGIADIVQTRFEINF